LYRRRRRIELGLDVEAAMNVVAGGQFENVTCTEESCRHRICVDKILMYK
jgi:hypothetical protein